MVVGFLLVLGDVNRDGMRDKILDVLELGFEEHLFLIPFFSPPLPYTVLILVT